MRLSIALFLQFALASGVVCAQESESDLRYNLQQMKQASLEREMEQRQTRGGSLPLPFSDDFSRYSLPTSNPEIPVEWQLWEEDYVYLNNHHPLNPPTIGVATFDGLNRDGYPYNFDFPDAYGPADTLTSLPVNLAPYGPDDNVYLSFFYQPEGRGNDPQPEDSLLVEFFSPDDDAWFHIWSVPGSELVDFQQVFLKVEQPWFFRDGFRFRFRNYSTLSGNVDHWHIDYVFLDQNIDPATFELIDVGFVHPVSSLLQVYSAAPWTHFTSDPESHMLGSVQALQGNLNADRNISSGFRVSYNGISQGDFPNLYLNTSGNGFSQFNCTLPVLQSPPQFAFDSAVNDTCASFDVSLYTNTTPDQNRNNDTLRFKQDFSNYYAYDDGSAERAYAVNEAGSRVAMRYVTWEPDTLYGLQIHFAPVFDNHENENFLLRIWADNGGNPGGELIENFEFNSPIYYDDGYNIFTYYPFDEPVYVSGSFFVGWVQDSDAKLNVGNDKNTNGNFGNLYYALGTTGPWVASGVSGSVMIRPVFRAGKSNPPVGVEQFRGMERLRVHPNPAESFMHLQWEAFRTSADVEVIDMSGRQVMTATMSGYGGQLDIAFLSSGLYIVQVSDRSGRIFAREKLMHN